MTIFFLFFLGILNRFLGALKTQLEGRWEAQARHKGALEEIMSLEEHTHEVRVRKESDHEANEDTQPLSPMPLSADVDDDSRNGLGQYTKGLWIASAPWSFKKDGIKALLEFTRALIGYIL